MSSVDNDNPDTGAQARVMGKALRVIAICSSRAPIGSTTLWFVELPAEDVRMPAEMTVASALDSRSRSSSRSPQQRNVRLPSSDEQILRASVRLPEQETDLFLLGILD